MTPTDEQIRDLVHDMYVAAESSPWQLTPEEIRSMRGRRGLPVPDLKVFLLVAAAVVLVVVGIGVARDSHGHGSTATTPTTTSSTAIGTKVSVPAGLIGTQVADATAILQAAGLKTTTTSRVNSSSIGTVLAESPTAGEEVARGSTVALTVSSGPEAIRVPNVIGLSQAQAASALGQAGLNVGSITTVPSTTFSAGEIVSEHPGADSSVPPASSVSLAVSSGP